MIGPFYGMFCLDDDEPSGSIEKLYLNCLISLIFESVSTASDTFECLKYASTVDVHESVHRDITMQLTNKMDYID
jgi:hypothetical protein